ncbi:MAG: hypothetical protein ACI8PZ_002099 [Myxococcota bacterium]|jgi:hypothetical protein
MRQFLVPLALGLLLPGVAAADTVVLTPLLQNGVDGKVLGNVHQLLASELDFASGVDKVVELPQRPTTLSNTCLVSTRCLNGIAVGNGGERLITGTIHARGSDYGLELLLYDAASNTIVRRKEFPVPSDSTQMANGMTSIITELLTGEDPDATAAAAPSVAAFEAGNEEDFDFDGDPLAPAPAPAATSDDDLAAISFGGSPADITVEDIDSIQFGAPSTDPVPAPVAVAPLTPPPSAVANLEDAPKTRSRTPSEKPERGGSSATIERPGANTLQFTLRGGYANYYRFNFVTIGGEFAVPVVAGLHILAGVEAYGTSRTLPPDIALVEGSTSAWETIFPYNLGAMYKITGGIVQPYGGADLIVVQYYKDDIGSDWAAGVRARLGSDFMIIDSFGLNVNIGLGMWSGKNWPLIEQGVGSTGLLPQVSAGTVVAF